MTDLSRLFRRRAGLAAAIVAAAWVAAGPAAATAQEPAEGDESIMLAPTDLPAGSVLGSSLLADEPLPPPSAVESVLASPEVLDVSAAASRGMLVEDLRLDEMPFEASSGRWFWNGGWYVGAESMWMQRSRENRQKIAEDININGPARFPQNYTTTGQPFDVSPGARVTIGKSLGRDSVDRDRAAEFVYYGGMNWYDYAGWNALPGGVIITPLNLDAAGFNYAGRYETTVRSDFNSWELNYRLRRRLGRDQLVMGPGGDWIRHAERGFLPGLIVGTRLARMTEGFTLKSSRPDNGSTSVLPPVPPSQFGGFYQINTQNWLLGLNLGAELVSQNEFFYWGLRGRAAPAITFANMSQAATGVNTTTIGPSGTTSLASASSQVGAGFLGDMTIMAGWQVTPNFSFQAGYDFLWVAGVATSERQFNLDNKDVNDIDAGGQAFYQGFSVGCYGSW
ncbi:MAG: BBP7 family outer membrane beta-barrel protein [Planctomycetaceae bacterium]